MTEKQLNAITEYLKENVWRNGDIMYADAVETKDGKHVSDVISSLHNLLYEVVTGERYNYAFHWANKIGMWTEDNIFDEILDDNKEDPA